MKKQHLLIAFFELIVLIVVASCFADDTVYQFRLPEHNEPIYGTWVNEKYGVTEAYSDQKWIYYNWGYIETYQRLSDKNPSHKCTYILVEKWQDADGNLWYKEIDLCPGEERSYWIDKISDDGKTLEVWRTYNGFPNLIPNSNPYRIFYRQ
jgi:hypothetical protein